MPYLTVHIALIVLAALIAAIVGGMIGWWLRSRKADAVETRLLSNLEQEVSAKKALNIRIQQLETAPEKGRNDKTPRQIKMASSRPAISGGRDDLKKIPGIGPVLEQKLNDMGITTFYQVAKLSDVEIDNIAAQLRTFPDRIRRDNWMKGASEQYHKTHG